MGIEITADQSGTLLGSFVDPFVKIRYLPGIMTLYEPKVSAKSTQASKGSLYTSAQSQPAGKETRGGTQLFDQRIIQRETAEYRQPFFKPYRFLMTVSTDVEISHAQPVCQPFVCTHPGSTGNLLQQDDIGRFAFHQTGKGFQAVFQSPVVRPIVPQVGAKDGDFLSLCLLPFCGKMLAK